jgi:transcriptional regulator with GAF, ATPase, and Fis domain
MERWIRAGVIAALAVSLGVAWLGYRDGRAWVGRTYPGFLVLPSGTLAPLGVEPEREVLQEHGLRPRDRIAAVDGRSLATGAELQEIVGSRRPGELLRYTVERPGGARLELEIPARAMPGHAVRRLFLPMLIGGLLAIAAGALGVLARPDLPTARLLFLFCWTSAMNFFVAGPDFALEHRLVPWSFLLFAAPSKATLLHLAGTFPQPRPPLRGPRRRAWLAALYALLLVQSAAYAMALGRSPALVLRLDALSYATYAFGFLALVANVIATARRAPDERLRQQARVALAGPTFCLVVFAGFSVVSLAWPALRLPIFFTTSVTVVFAVSLTYALLRHNLFEFDAVLRRGLAAAAVLAGVGLVYLGLFAALDRWLGEPAAWVSVALAVGAVGASVPGFRPLRERVERLVAAQLFPEARAAREAVAEAGPRLAALRDAEQVDACVRELVGRGLRARDVRVLRLRAGGRPADPPGAGADPPDALLEACRAGEAVHLDDAGRRVPAPLREALAAQAVRVLAPFPRGSGEVVGGIACGPRSDGRLYTSEDLEHLEALAAQAAVALSNVAAFEDVRRLQERLAEENELLRAEIQLQHGFDEIVGGAAGLRSALAQVEQVAPTDVTVLVTGETGTGKELIVRALHALSPRRERPLVKLACAAIPETLLESELFGHERGAFTGAERAREGRFEAADGGTLFFDDVDALPLGVQAKLLRAIQEGEVQRLGSGEVRRVDVRVIAATNRDLLDRVRAGAFRQDLYYRLHVVPIELPPLRERREDLRALAEHFVLTESRKLGREAARLSAGALAELTAYAWPGNVRELRNVIERAVVLHRGGGEIELPEPLAPPEAAAADEPGADAPLDEQVRAFKVRAIRAALAASGGNQRGAAERLGLHRQSLTRMIRELELRSGP